MTEQARHAATERKRASAVLSPERLRTLLADFKRLHGAEYHLLALGYFGSYARDAATPESDSAGTQVPAIDIVFDTDAPNLFLTAMLKQDLEAWLGRPVDVLQARGLTNLRLKARVEREAVYV